MSNFVALSRPLDQSDIELLTVAAYLKQITFGQLVLASTLGLTPNDAHHQWDDEAILVPN